MSGILNGLDVVTQCKTSLVVPIANGILEIYVSSHPYLLDR